LFGCGKFGFELGAIAAVRAPGAIYGNRKRENDDQRG